DRAYLEEETIIVAIEYEAQPRAGLYFVHPEIGYPDKPWQIWSQGEMEFNSHWFPCYDFPNDRMTSEMIVTVPKWQMAISNGELLAVTENDASNTITYHWKESVPHVTYLLSLVVGEFLEARDEWTGGSPRRNGVPVTYYVEPQDSHKVARSFHKTVEMMDFFSHKTGIDYPYEKYAQTTIRDFMWGGMENISATTLTRNTLHDQRAHLDYTSDGLVAHELAHQWWGDLLTCNNWNHIWLNESFATYFDALYVDHDMGNDEFIMEMQQNRNRYLKEDSTKYRRPIVYNLYEDASQMFDRHTYQKGSWVLHMIRYILGDELWWKAI
ncbi:MAG: aminopeptidase, partial [Aliifodinibius sp.]|nr:M1 family metallopeptidase [Fodinibius sp.]NIW45493.1 aminopeptidase [Gammaproteobacteria bacterium]NIY26509.1 aminopeptidase [Fodinibius sp.]